MRLRIPDFIRLTTQNDEKTARDPRRLLKATSFPVEFEKLPSSICMKGVMVAVRCLPLDDTATQNIQVLRRVHAGSRFESDNVNQW